MALTTDNIKYGTSTAITCTLASLGNSQTVGRQSAVVDNTSNLYIDALLTIKVKSAGSVAAPFAVYVYLFGSEDGTFFEEDDAATGGGDATYTVNFASNLRGPAVISTPTTATTYAKVISVASYFGGVMPRKWGFVIVNNSGASLDSTEGNHQKSYTGVVYTNQ